MTWKKPPSSSGYYAVIFSSTKSEHLEGYAEMDQLTMNLAQEQSGFLGYESVNAEHKGIFISYWETKEDIEQWKQNMTHIQAKSNAKQWYKRYLSQICYVEYSHLFEQNND